MLRDSSRSGPPRRPALFAWAALPAIVGLLGLTACSDGSGASSDMTGAGTTLQVGPGGSGGFTSLQSAVSAASPGDTIQVSAGSLQEQVVVDKPLTIRGAGSSSTTLQASGTPLAFSDDGSDDSSAVLIIRNTSGVVLEGIRVQGPQDGIQVRNSSAIRLLDIVATGNGDDGLDIRGSTDVTASGTFGSNGDRGIQIREGASDVRVENCVLESNVDDGLRVREASAVSVVRCDSTGNGGDGFEFRDTSGSALRDSSARSNAEYGLRVRSSADLIEEGNVLEDNVQGNRRVE